MADEKDHGAGGKFKAVMLALFFGAIGIALASYCLASYFINKTITFANFMDTITSSTFKTTFTYKPCSFCFDK